MHRTAEADRYVDPVLHGPSLRPAEVHPRRLHLEDTLETAISGMEAAPIRGPRLVTRPAVQEETDGVLLAVGVGMVASMMSLLMMLASGYGAT